MQLSKLQLQLPFLEFSFSYSDGITSIEGNLEGRLNTSKLSKLLKTILSTPLWLDFSEISNTPAETIRQLDLLGQSIEPILLLRPDNTVDSRIFVFKFKRHQTNEQLYYGKDQKNLIETIAKIWLTNFVNQSALDNAIFEKYFQICKNQLVKINQLNDELTNRNLESQKLLNDLFNFFLKEELQPLQKISLSDSAIDYLRSCKLSFDVLEKMAKEAFKTAKALYPSSADIRIKKYYFITPEVENASAKPARKPAKFQIAKPEAVEMALEKAETPETTMLPSSKLPKTILLLDRYETAVKKLIDDKLPVMGKNIASACIPSISPPALTDSINKHRDRIIECLKTYPERWVLLKTNYLPVQKLSY